MRCNDLSPSLIASTLVMLSVSSVATFADATGDARKAIETALHKTEIAATKKDANGMMATYSNDYTFVTKKGQTLTIQMMRGNVAQLVKGAKSLKLKVSIQKFTLSNNYVTSILREDAIAILPNQKTKHDSTLKLSAVSEDIWTKTNGLWHRKRGTQISSSALLDGQKLPDQ